MAAGQETCTPYLFDRIKDRIKQLEEREYFSFRILWHEDLPQEINPFIQDMGIIVDKTLEQCIHNCARYNARAAPGYDSILNCCFLVSVDLYGTFFLKTVYNSTTWPPIAGSWLHRRAGNGFAIVSWVGMDMHSIWVLKTMEEEEDEITILDGLVVIISGYHKTQWRIGTRPVARFLPPAVGNLLARYLIYVPSSFDSCTAAIYSMRRLSLFG